MTCPVTARIKALVKISQQREILENMISDDKRNYYKVGNQIKKLYESIKEFEEMFGEYKAN